LTKQLFFARIGGMKKIIYSLIVFTALLLLGTKLVSADGTYGQYGGTTEPGKVIVDKLVRHPQTGKYVDNLGLEDSMYSASATVFYKIIIENVGKSTLSEVHVTDYLPIYLQYVSGGNYESVNREVKFTFDNVAPGDRRSTVLQVKVYSLSQLPAEKTILCPINKVVAYSSQDGSDEDTAQLCIKKKPMVEKEAPKAGDPLALAMGFGSLTTLIGGLKLKRKYA
jgi:uncharacterized repeat protein (TIGR01451 family)